MVVVIVNTNSQTAQAFAEKDLLNATYLPTSNPANGAPQLNLRHNRPKRAMMSRLQHICCVVFALAVLAITLVGASTSGNHALSAEAQQFRDLLDTLDATTLHEILHEHFKDKYQHGVYQGDKSALEALHRQNAAVAQNLVQLAKRQDGTNGSVTTTTAVETTTTEVTQTVTSTSTPPPVVVDPPTTPTPTPTPTTTPPVVIPDTSTTTSIPNPPVSTTTSSASPPPVSSTTTQASSTTSLVSSSVASTLVSSTTARTSTSATPTGSSGSSRVPEEDDVTTSIVFTTTLADGATSTATIITVVPAAQATKPSGTGASTNTANASLQTGLASSQYQLGGWAAGVGFLGMAAAWGL